MFELVAKAREFFNSRIKENTGDPFGLMRHVPEVERWAQYLLKLHEDANREIVLVAVWLHDIGHYPLADASDHAVRSCEIARKFLSDHYCVGDFREAVLHCIRSHRSWDVHPRTLEAQILVFADSASHATDSMYFDIARDDRASGSTFRSFGKIQRDLRDLEMFPEIAEKLTVLFDAWGRLIRAYEDLDIP